MTIFDYLLQSTWSQKLRFFGLFFVIFTITYGILFALDWLPEAPAEASAETTVVETVGVEEVGTAVVALEEIPAPAVILSNAEYPRELVIGTLNRTVAVRNPESRTIADLDAALLGGVVRHPDSVKLGEEGNVFILGHSSYLPNVLNRNFQAFNGIQNLVWGDSIVVRSDTQEYVYQVKKVYKAKASALTIPVAVAGKRLTLATCNSFGSVDDRHIVEAELVDTRPLSSVRDLTNGQKA
jgi:LPXTG-site transpeptidase (sortase) family protein